MGCRGCVLLPKRASPAYVTVCGWHVMEPQYGMAIRSRGLPCITGKPAVLCIVTGATWTSAYIISEVKKNMRALFVGLDVSKDDFMAVVKDDRNNLVMAGKSYKHDSQGLAALSTDMDVLKERFGCRALFGMEATGIYHLSLYQHLLSTGEHVKVFNSLELKRFKGRIRKTKTDRLDAEAIAEAMLLTIEPCYHPVTEPELLRLREMGRLRDRLLKKISKCKVQTTRDMDMLCRGYSSLFTDIFSTTSLAVMKATVKMTSLFVIEKDTLKNLLSDTMAKNAAEQKTERLHALFQNAVVPEHMKETGILEIRMLIQEYELLSQQIQRIEHKIEKQVLQTNTRILSIPGIGPLTAGVILGELGDLKRFNSLDQITAYAGLDPSVMESGRSRRTGHISKRGSPILRDALYKSSLSASRCNPVCQQLYQRLRDKGKHHKVCMIAVSRKLLHIAYSVETKQKDFYVPIYITNQDAETPLKEKM